MHYKTHRTFSHLLCFRGKLENSHKAVLVRQPEAGRLGDPTKGQKFQNEFMKSSFLPKYERKIVRISALQCTEVRFFRWIYYCHTSKSTGKETGKTQNSAVVYRAEILTIFRSYFGRNDDFINSF